MPLFELDPEAMNRAIAASSSALASGNMPFGASLVDKDGNLLLVAENNQNTQQDCTGHAEMVLVRKAASELGPHSLHGATVYASGEPCPMCSGALFWAGVKRVVFAASQNDIAANLGGPVLPITSAAVLNGAQPSVEVIGLYMSGPAIEVLKRFQQL